MSEEQSRGRRRPSREYHQAPSTSRRPREPSITEEPVSLKKKLIKMFLNLFEYMPK